MSTTVDWTDEVTTDFQMETNSSEAVTTTARNPGALSVLVAYKTTIMIIGILGTLSNALVLGGFWLADRSKITASSIHIANHTTLEQFILTSHFLDQHFSQL